VLYPFKQRPRRKKFSMIRIGALTVAQPALRQHREVALPGSEQPFATQGKRVLSWRVARKSRSLAPLAMTQKRGEWRESRDSSRKEVAHAVGDEEFIDHHCAPTAFCERIDALFCFLLPLITRHSQNSQLKLAQQGFTAKRRGFSLRRV
jgi:hypothetical protein